MRDLPPQEPAEPGRDRGGFLTGLVLGAAIGAGVALLLAPASGKQTRRVLRRRARGVERHLTDGWVSARETARDALREKKEAIKNRLQDGIERIEDELGV